MGACGVERAVFVGLVRGAQRALLLGAEHPERVAGEILVNNFLVFHDVAREDRYDLWVGDEAWELDYYLHENPREKRARYAWLTDFVGWLPMPDGGERARRT